VLSRAASTETDDAAKVKPLRGEIREQAELACSLDCVHAPVNAELGVQVAHLVLIVFTDTNSSAAISGPLRGGFEDLRTGG
jgi:hypothetical protein